MRLPREQTGYRCPLPCSPDRGNPGLHSDGGKLASDLLKALREQDLPELAAKIAPDWDLTVEAVQSGLETLCSHLELVRDDTALLYEML